MKISFHNICLVVMAVAAMCGCSLNATAQQLKAENIDEIVKAMTLEEKCHMVLGRGMHFNDEAKFLVQPVVHSRWLVWVSPKPIVPTLSKACA